MSDRKQRILEYAKNQSPRTLSTLGFSIIKTDEQFVNAYVMHDLALNYTARQYLKNGFYLYPLGVDMRKHAVIIENELPDYIVEKGTDLFCFDAKAKSSTNSFGLVNERAANSYRNFAKECSVLVYLIFVKVVANRVFDKVGYCSISDEPIEISRAWDGNKIWVFRWSQGIPNIRT